MSKFYALSSEATVAQIFEKKAPANRGFGVEAGKQSLAPLLGRQTLYLQHSGLSRDKQFHRGN
jgi:hypothetical protein